MTKWQYFYEHDIGLFCGDYVYDVVICIGLSTYDEVRATHELLSLIAKLNA